MEQGLIGISCVIEGNELWPKFKIIMKHRHTGAKINCQFRDPQPHPPIFLLKSLDFYSRKRAFRYTIMCEKYFLQMTVICWRNKQSNCRPIYLLCRHNNYQHTWHSDLCNRTVWYSKTSLLLTKRNLKIDWKFGNKLNSVYIYWTMP